MMSSYEGLCLYNHHTFMKLNKPDDFCCRSVLATDSNLERTASKCEAAQNPMAIAHPYK